MAATYPSGYSGQMLTWDQMWSKSTVNKLQPEFLRRFKALMDLAASEGVPLGIGTGWRAVQPSNKPGFAQPGNSNHEGFEPGNTWAVAIDTVPNTSWAWMESHLAAYGMRSFRNVNSEPWHVQPSDIPTSRRYRKERWNLAQFPLPGTAPPVSQPQPDEEDEMDGYLTRYAPDNSIWVLDPHLSTRHRVSEDVHNQLKASGKYGVLSFADPNELVGIPATSA